MTELSSGSSRRCCSSRRSRSAPPSSPRPATRARPRSTGRSTCSGQRSRAAGVVLREVAGGHTLAADPDAEEAARRLLRAPEDAAAHPGAGRDAGDRRLPAAGLAAGDRAHPRRLLGVRGADADRARADRGVGPLALRRRDLPHDAAVRAPVRPLGPGRAARPAALRPLAGGRDGAARAAAAGRRAAGRADRRRRMRLAKYLAHSGVASRRARRGAGRRRPGPGRRPASCATRRATSTTRAASRSIGARSARSRARSGSLNKPAGVTSTAREPGRRRAVTEPDRLPAAPLSGRPPRRRLDRPDPGHERRRAREPAHPPALRGSSAPTGRGCGGRRPRPSCGG